MEIANLEISSQKNKGKGTMPPVNSGRNKNWTLEETNILLECVADCQQKRGSIGFSFKKDDYTFIERAFKDKIKDTVYDKHNIENRIKVLVKRFKACYELAQTTGGGWDSDTNKPIAPSQLDYIAMVQAKGPNASFLKHSSFPWYNTMLPMRGGQSASGQGRNVSFNPREPSLPYLLLEGPVQVSEQGSSDEPEELNDIDDCSAARTSNNRRGGQRQSSAGTYSASKRKSTDESAGETSKRATRYKEKHKQKQADKDRLAEAGFELAKSMRIGADRTADDRQEIKDSIDKIRSLKMSAVAQDYLMDKIVINPGFRGLFLTWSETEVVEWLTAKNVFGNKQHSRNNPEGFSAMLDRDVSRQGFPDYNI